MMSSVHRKIAFLLYLEDNRNLNINFQISVGLDNILFPLPTQIMRLKNYELIEY